MDVKIEPNSANSENNNVEHPYPGDVWRFRQCGGHKRNTTILGCWGDANKGDSVKLKFHFVGNGALLRHDENQVKKRKHRFGARKIEHSSTFNNIYWPSGLISRYHIRRIGPI